MNYALGDISLQMYTDIVKLDLSKLQERQLDENLLWSSITLLGQDAAGSTNHGKLIASTTLQSCLQHMQEANFGAARYHDTSGNF